MKLLKDVFIKLMRGGATDRVLFIDNVPEEFFYSMKHPLEAVGQGQGQHWQYNTAKDKVLTLHEEIKLSQTGDGGLVFDLDNEPSTQRYLALMRYIKMKYPANQNVPEAVSYAVDPKDTKSPLVALSQVPRVVLPVLSPTESQDSLNSGATSISNAVDIEKIKADAIKEHEAEKKRKFAEKMAKARAGRIKTS